MNEFSEIGADVAELKMIKSVSKSSKGQSYDVQRGSSVLDYVSDNFSSKSISKLNKQTSIVYSKDIDKYAKHLEDVDKLNFNIFALKKEIGHAKVLPVMTLDALHGCGVT